MVINGCQWSGVAMMAMSGFSRSNQLTVIFVLFRPVAAFTFRAVGSRKRSSTSPRATTWHWPEAMASPRMLLPHQPAPIRAVRYFLSLSPPRRGTAEKASPAAREDFRKPRRLMGLFAAGKIRRFILAYKRSVYAPGIKRKKGCGKIRSCRDFGGDPALSITWQQLEPGRAEQRSASRIRVSSVSILSSGCGSIRGQTGGSRAGQAIKAP
jgi:hypothetical protein